MEKQIKDYLLIESREYFYDGHGVPALGEVKLSVTHISDVYKDLDFSKTYNEDLEILEDGYDEEKYAEDGYHCRTVELNLKKITENEYNEYSKIISDYDKLLNI